MLQLFKKFFSSSSLRRFQARVEAINGLESEIQALGDEGLKKESFALRSRARAEESLDALLPRAFALVREAAKRTLGQRPFDVQLLCGMALHEGAIAEMVTGEGKTLAAVAPAYLNALSEMGVHVVTVNEYLARRDAVWMGQIYRALGLSVACLVPNTAFLYDPEWHAQKEDEKTLDQARDATGSFLVQQDFLRPISRREAYLADVTYGTNHEFGFDYLRDNLAYRPFDQAQLAREDPRASEKKRGHYFAIIDEADNILIDEARTPLIIAVPDSESSEFYKTFARIATHLEKDKDFTVDEKLRSVAITEQGIEKVEKLTGLPNIYAPEHLRLVHYLEESLRAKAIFHRDKDYVVKNGEIVIVDEFTGRLLHGRRYSGGLHQAIEAKEGVQVQQESRTYAKISIQNYFRMYEKIAGMTGTAQTSAEEFHKVYRLEVMSIPTHRPLVRKDLSDKIYKNAQAKWQAAVGDIKQRHEQGQPILIGTTSITKNELVSALLTNAGIPHEVLNAKNNEREGAIIAQAGRFKAVTVATNMAGRGVDIILGGNPSKAEEAQKIKDLGGLHVIGTERHEARRIDNQLRGRAGRQGDPGSSQFYLSLDDDLLRIFGGERIKGIMERFDVPDDQPIEVKFVSSAVAQAQTKVEGANFDLRKHLLEYDDVLNKQRGAVYKRRQEILGAGEKGELANIIFEAADGHLEALLSIPQGLEGEPAAPDMKKIFEETGIATSNAAFPTDPSPENLKHLLTKRSVEASADPQTFARVLSILDLLWMNHLENLEALSESIGLRAYAQKDPLVEYRHEAHRLFKDFWLNFNAWLFMNIFKLAQAGAVHGGVSQSVQQRPSFARASEGKVGRNDPCPCGAKKPNGQPVKYKRCHGA